MVHDSDAFHKGGSRAYAVRPTGKEAPELRQISIVLFRRVDLGPRERDGASPNGRFAGRHRLESGNADPLVIDSPRGSASILCSLPCKMDSLRHARNLQRHVSDLFHRTCSRVQARMPHRSDLPHRRQHTTRVAVMPFAEAGTVVGVVVRAARDRPVRVRMRVLALTLRRPP
jgi:hypothetical protein